MNRRSVSIAVWLLGLALLLCLSAAIGIRYRHFARVEKGFASVELGQSRSSVLSRLGTPDYHDGSCGVIHVPESGCSVEFVYSHPFAPFIPDYYIVSFDADGKVIEAERWTSP